MASILQLILVIVNIVIPSIYCWENLFCDDKKNDEALLDLSSVGIQRLRRSFVSSSMIVCLNLANNHLTSIESEAFEGLDNLRSLNISSNAIDFEGFCRMKKFKKLRTLVLDEAIFEGTIPPSTDGYGDYEYSDYDRYNRRTIRITTPARPEFTLGHLNWISLANIPMFPNLERLSMSHYRINRIGNALVKFGDMPNLTHLRVAGNELTSVADLPLKYYPNLTHLNLDDNEVSVFPGSTLTNLRHLSMNNNKIMHLCSIYCDLSNSMTPGAMKSLESLSLTGNLMTTIIGDAFANSANLMFLDLSNNSIELFPRHTFDNLTNLRNLTVNDNRLDQIPDICGLDNLRALSLDGNRIIAIDETSFCNLPRLTHVSLQRNGLSIVAPGTFGHLPALTSLDLFGNKLASLPENWIRSGIKLDRLNLDANEFVELSSMSLHNLEDLGYLSIGRNPLETITIGSLMTLPINTTINMARVCDA